jgi:hypothetical protein
MLSICTESADGVISIMYPRTAVCGGNRGVFGAIALVNDPERDYFYFYHLSQW